MGEAVDDQAWETARDVGEVRKAVAATGREVRDTRQALDDHAWQAAEDAEEVHSLVGEVGEAVDDQAWEMARAVGEVQRAAASVDQGSRQILANTKAGGRYVFVDRRGTETRYVLAGFNPGEHELKSYHRVWLWDLYRTRSDPVATKRSRGRKVRMLGFASSERFDPDASPWSPFQD